MDKEKAIEDIKAICKTNKKIGLYLAQTEVAGWKQKDKRKMTFDNIKCIGYVSAISSAFDITPEDLKVQSTKNASKKHIK